MESKTLCVCAACGKFFARRTTELKRNLKRFGYKYKIVCSSKCSGKINNKHLQSWQGKYNNNLKKGRDSDDYSPFRNILRKAIQHKKEHHDFNLTLEYLKELWEQQNGKCPLSGQDIILSTKTTKSIGLIPNAASLDRIDSSKGYVIGNVRFVSLIAQMAKYVFTDEDVIKFCRLVCLKYKE